MTYLEETIRDIGADPLWARLRLVEERVRYAVAARRAVDPDPDDPYRGQYLTPEAAQRILDGPGGLDVPGYDPQPPPPGSALGTLAERFGLAPLDTDLLLIALAPDLDARFERLYGYLNDDLTRRRPTVGLALELCGLGPASAARFRFSPGAPLVAGGLLEVTDPERPPLSRVLVVPDRVTGYLLGDTAPDARLAGVLGTAAADPTAEPDEVRRAARAVRSGPGLVHLLDRGGDAPGLAATALCAAGLGTLVLDTAALARRPADLPVLARVAALEARLTGAGVVLGPLADLPSAPAERARSASELCAALRGIPLFTHGTDGWDPSWAADTPIVLPVNPPSPARQAARWRHALALAGADTSATGATLRLAGTPVDSITLPLTEASRNADALPLTEAPTNGEALPPTRDSPDGRTAPPTRDAPDADALPLTEASTDGEALPSTGTPTAGDADALARAVAAHRLDGGQLRRAAGAAVRSAGLAGRPVSPGDLRAAVRAQNGAGLARLARRVEPDVGWDDLVLPSPTRRRLRELAVRARHRDQVLGQWRMRPGGGRGRGVIALFAGESGTGKTMSAEVVAADLGMDLYVVDLSTVVDKYVGETEKNLERIFTEASAVNAVLLFDEADAIFGKRSEVKDAHDRHANIESAYLLQRMESFDGIAVLTTNLRANLDEAFTRRLDVVAEFPVPDAAQRLALWERCLGERLPRAADLDLRFCADRFELAGGSIRACAVTAAYLAAEAEGPLTMRQLVSAVVQEYRKLGRLVLESEFGPYLADVLGA
ncbi:ATP-binding protein [Streptomyces camelliae]|uniref:AAA family ATPase n=1 Tax=Streptomyces camelliae TaxID=3004093 RepID=A0ABY7PGG2_9ACTN|nr:AAA family ATPase [Streptomyces sp. HUAS 2-6]WBO68398.1 AAA family ATPase [Streptomyces sp. HUAS 2-6]